MRLVITLLSVFLTFQSFAQVMSFDSIREMAKSACLEFEYSFESMEGDTPMTYSGTGYLQDDVICVKTMLLDMYSDGKSLWLVDPVAKEVVIEHLGNYPFEVKGVSQISKVGYRMDVKMSDGTMIVITIPSLKTSVKRPAEDLIPQFGSSYVITDLR